MNNVAPYIASLCLAVFPVIGMAQEKASEPPSLKCEVGPIQKTYGDTQWLVYSCEDGQTVVFVSAPGSPAMPFYFMLYKRENVYRLYGEGTGRKEATVAAHDELKLLSASDIAALVEQTKAPKRR